MSNKRTKVAETEDLPKNGSRVIVEVDGRDICLFRYNNQYFAVLNYCVHQAGPLCEGPLDGQIVAGDDWEWEYDDEEKYISCPWHGWTFDITTGVSVKDKRYRVPTYDVQVEEDSIYILQ